MAAMLQKLIGSGATVNWLNANLPADVCHVAMRFKNFLIRLIWGFYANGYGIFGSSDGINEK